MSDRSPNRVLAGAQWLAAVLYETSRATWQTVSPTCILRTARRLKEMASQEEAVTKERLAVRTGAARSFARASAPLEGARAAWGRAQAEAAEAKAKAVVDLLGTGMQVGEVAGLLGVTERELKALRTAAVRRDEKANGGRRSGARDGQSGRGAATSPVGGLGPR